MDIEVDVKYIYNYIKYVFFNVDELRNNRYVIDISKRLKNKMPNSNFSSGKYDFYINNFVGQELKTRKSSSYVKFQNIKKHVYLILNYYKIYHGENVVNYDAMICEIMRTICSNFDYEEIIDGKCDMLIESLIQSNITYKFNPNEKEVNIPVNVMYISSENGKIVDDRENIYVYILRILQVNSNVFKFDGDLRILAEIICNDICSLGIKIDDILSQKYDDLIIGYIRQNRYGIEYSSEFRRIQIEVSKYVMNNNTYMEISNHDEKIASEIFRLSKKLLDDGFTSSDVAVGKCNSIMEHHLRFDCIMSNSKKCNQNKKEKRNPNKFLLSLNKTFYPIRTKALTLALIATIAGGALTAVNVVNADRVDYEQVDEYDYPDIEHEMDREFDKTLEHIMFQYVENASINPLYGQICLYKAFESIESEPYHAMDAMFAMIKERAKYNEDIKVLYEDIKGCDSYAHYIFNNMAKNNSGKLNESMRDAVITYNSQVANYKELNPYGLLERDEKSALKDLEKEYGKYIEQLEKEMEKECSKEK